MHIQYCAQQYLLQATPQCLGYTAHERYSIAASIVSPLLLLLLRAQGPVRCLDAAGPWVVSGGQDDQLHIYDAKVRHAQPCVWLLQGAESGFERHGKAAECVSVDDSCTFTMHRWAGSRLGDAMQRHSRVYGYARKMVMALRGSSVGCNRVCEQMVGVPEDRRQAPLR